MASSRDKMVLSPCTTEAVNSLADLLGKGKAPTTPPSCAIDAAKEMVGIGLGIQTTGCSAHKVMPLPACSNDSLGSPIDADDGMETEDSGSRSSSQAYSAHGQISSQQQQQQQPAPSRILFAQDCLNANNTQFCVEYAHEIFDHLLATEHKMMPASDYMERVQHDINPTMRGILVDWLVEVSEEYKLSSENLYLSTNYVDRFLTVMPVMRGRLQLVGVSCMLIASKYEEIFAPQVDDFVYITDNTYSSTEVPILPRRPSFAPWSVDSTFHLSCARCAIS
jgi:hypothetical protein